MTRGLKVEEFAEAVAEVVAEPVLEAGAGV